MANSDEHLRQKGLKKARKAAVETIQRNAAESYSDLLPTMREMRDTGKSLQAIADHLNDLGHTTRRGKPWNRMQVSRVLKDA